LKEDTNMDMEETVCFCGNVTVGEIKAAVEAGATTVEAVGEATGAGTHCGGCQDRIAELIEEFKK